MTPELLGGLWALPIQHKNTLGLMSEAIIERIYRTWLRPGDVAVDVGSNVGRHLFPLADCVGIEGRVLGFEPIPELAAQLAQKISDSGLQDAVLVRNLAVSNQTGIADFHHNLSVPAMSGLKVRSGLPESSQDRVLQIKVDTLDNLLVDCSPRFVKVDVEGAEFLVFKGAVNIMETSRPLFAFEDGRGGSARLNNYTMKEFYDFFEQHRYQILDIFGYSVNERMNSFNGPWNFYAVPIEKFEEAREVIVYGSLYELWSMMQD